MDSSRNLLEAHATVQVKFEDTIRLFRKRDLVGVEPERECACGAEVLTLCEECLAPFERGFVLRAFDRNAGNVRHLPDQLLHTVRRSCGPVVVNSKST